MPTLDSRKADIPEIAQAFLIRQSQKLGKDLRTIEPAALSELLQRQWPGNVRELDNTIERAVILAEGPTLTLSDLQAQSTSSSSSFSRPIQIGKDSGQLPILELSTTDLRDAVRIYEREHISRVLADCGDDRRMAAAKLGLGLSSLYAKIRELGISQ
jgi:DNA-binding NtrC family response regulator